jgi:hypothetical protein
LDRLALSNQTQANTLAGLVLGWRNNEYPNVALPFAANHRMIDICPHQYLTLSITASDTVRGVSPTLTLVARSVSYSHDFDTGHFTCEVQAETTAIEGSALGAPGTPGDPPVEPPDPEYPPLPDPDPIPDPPLDPEWPAYVFAAGQTKGVYVSSDFTGPSGSMPTWTAINGSLPTTDVSHFGINTGQTGIKQQVCRLATNSGIYIRDTDVSGNWSSALSNSTVQSDLSGSADIQMMCVSYEGYIYVYVYDSSGPGSGGHKHFIYYSTNWGTSWNGPYELEDTGSEYDDNLVGAGMMRANNGIVWVAMQTSLYGSHVWRAQSHGDGTVHMCGDPLWFTNWRPPVFLHPAGDDGDCYTYLNQSGVYGSISQWDYAIQGDYADPVALETDYLWWYDTAANGDPRWESLWGSQTDDDFMRIVTYKTWDLASHFRVVETDDNWSTYDEDGTDIDDVTLDAQPHILCNDVSSDEDMILVGVGSLGLGTNKYYHAVVAMLTIDGTPVGRAGDSPDSSPYTDSIPYDFGPFAKGGLQAVADSISP